MTIDYLTLGTEDLRALTEKQLLDALAQVQTGLANHRKENSILYYEPVSEKAWEVHQSIARICGVSGGNRSSKTETCIAEATMLTTGMMPDRFREDPVFRSKFRGPIQVRIVVESLINTLWPAILPKFQWFKWIGVGQPGSGMGHWGWVPKSCLLKGDWEKSFSKTERCLTVLCRDPDNRHTILGESTIHFMSKDNDPEDFASGEFHIVIEDEPPTEAIHRENKVRTQSVNGRILLAMTWPDDPTIPVTWIMDQIYDPATGIDKDPDIDWFELDSRDNKHTMKDGLEFNMRHWSKEEIAVRVLGKPIRLSHLVHPLFRDRRSWWCFDCKEEVYVPNESKPQCKTCGRNSVVPYQHVMQEEPSFRCPVVFLLDPHPRKPHMMAWIAVTPDQELWQLAELQVEGTPGETRAEVDRVEREYKLDVRMRLMDPNMGQSSPGVRRSVTWKDEFAQVGLRCALADDSGIGHKRIDELLKPDPDTLRPRMFIHERCVASIKQFKRFQWDNYKVGAERGTKEEMKSVDDDFPTLWKYMVNADPSFRFLKEGAPVLGRRRGNG